MEPVIFTSYSPAEFDDKVKSIIAEAIRAELSNLKPTPAQEEQKYLTRAKTSKILGVSLVTLHQWEKNEILIPFRICSRVRYLKSDVDNLFKQRQ